MFRLVSQKLAVKASKRRQLHRIPARAGSFQQSRLRDHGMVTLIASYHRRNLDCVAEAWKFGHPAYQTDGRRIQTALPRQL